MTAYAAQHMGNSIRIPGEDAGDEDRQNFINKIMEKAPNLMVRPDLNDQEQADEFYKMLGRPDDSEGYVYEGEEQPANLKAFAEIAFNNGLNQKQFNSMVKSIVDSESAIVEASSEEQKEALRNLHAEWGMAYDTNVRAVQNYLEMTEAPEVLVEMIKEGEMSPGEMKWIFGMASQNKAAMELAKQPASTVTIMTPEEALNQISEIMNNSAHPYWNPSDPGNARAIKRMVELQQLANPGATTEFG
jgi:hypothetical protein